MSHSDEPLPRRLKRVRELTRQREFDRLRTLWSDRRPEVRLAILHALLEFHYVGVDDLLVKGLTDDDGGVRRQCIHYLRERAAVAVPALVACLNDPHCGPIAAAFLAYTAQGRQALSQRPDHGWRLLLRAVDLDELPADVRMHVVEALGDCPATEVCHRLVDLLGAGPACVRDCAAEQLRGRASAPAREGLLAWLERQWVVDGPTAEWLGYCDDPRALRILRRLASWRGRLALPSDVRRAVQRALRTNIARYGHIPEGAVSRSAPAGPAASDAGLSRGAKEPDEP